MNQKFLAHPFVRRAATGALFLAVTLGTTPVVWAQAAAPGTAARMQSEMATCDGVQQDKAACVREAGAARQEAGRGGLVTPDTSGSSANTMERCRLQPASDQADCMARIQGGVGNTSTSTSGSVMGGGVIRETVTTTPAK